MMKFLDRLFHPSNWRLGKESYAELECRLERMERRMSLLKQKEESHEIMSKEVPDTSSPKAPERGTKRKSTTQIESSATPSKCPAKRIGNNKTPLQNKQKIEKVHRKAAVESVVNDTPRLKIKDNEDINNDPVLKTNCVYHVLNSQLRSRCVEIFDHTQMMTSAKTQRDIEVPSWRIIKYTNLYQMEGTENLEDEMIIKRHQKPELEEKRRKRWDIQRMREQRAAKKLREKENSISVDEHMETVQDIDSFLPILDNITHIEIVDKLPVVAFGHPLPSLTEEEFELPWEYDKSTVNKRHMTSRSRRK